MFHRVFGKTNLRRFLILSLSLFAVCLARKTLGQAPAPETWSDHYGYAEGWRVDSHPRFLADVNGDKFPDVIGFAEEGVQVSLSTGKAFGRRQTWVEAFGQGSGWRADRHLRVMADVNGDGRQDIVGFHEESVQVALSTGKKSGSPKKWSDDFGAAQGWGIDTHPRYVADANGDGKADVIGFSGKAVLVALSTGETFQKPKAWLVHFGSDKGWAADRHPRLVGDINGDGKIDLAGFGDKGVEVALSTGDAFAPAILGVRSFGYSTANATPWRLPYNPRTLADLDGDGTADVVGFGDEGIYAAISTGDGFTDGALWVEDFSFEKQWHWELNPRFLADMNGDRRADVVGFGDDGVMVALSEAGQEFGRPRILVSGFGSEDGWSPERHLRMVTDLDADGRADIVGFGEKGITVFRSNLPVPETPAQPKWVEAGKTAAPAPLDEPDKAVGPEFPTGWRGDGTGRYPKAESPRIWSADDKVIWKTALPSGSNATPVVVGDRVFACSEPSDLICLDRENGKILWQVSSLRTETMTEEDERLARENEEKSRGVGKELNALRNELNGVRMKLKKDPKNGDLFSRFSKLKREVALKNREYEKLVGYLQPRTQSVNGYSSPTPVSDGQSIYVLYGTGVAASYDLVGHRHWIRFIEAPDHIWGHSASPRLAGSVLVVHINDLRGLNSETGQDIWRVKLPPSWGTPIIAAIPETGAENSPLAHVIVTPQGDVARADTGNILARRLFRMPYGSPLLEENVVYAVDQQGAVAIRLPESMEGGFQTEELWRTRPRRDRYYASPVLAGGYLHAANSTHYYSVLDARTGEVAYETKMPFGSGAIYPSLCLAGGLVYLSNEDGRTLLVEPGPGLKTVADNTLEPFRATPVFRDGRMYVRTLENLYCIGQ